jgi:CheY-like chemotaxis protein
MPNFGTILLVENDPNDVTLTLRALDDVGVRNPVQVLPSGSEAIAYFNGDGKYADRTAWPLPFLMLTDYRMPEGDGLLILEWLATQSDFLKTLVVIVLSSTCSDREIKLFYELGAKSFLLKPISYRDLVAIMRRVKEFWIDTFNTPGNT